MKLEDLIGVAGPLGHADRILLFGWWLHVHVGKATFMPADVNKCYHVLHLALPSGSLGPYVAQLQKTGQLLKNAVGYRLESTARAAAEKKYGQRPVTVAITAILDSLPAKLPDLAERTYLDEALICYRNNAFRAAIVMTWNLAYAHLCDHIVNTRLTDFNARWQQDYKGDHKNGIRRITIVQDFADEELKEHKVLKLCLDAGIVTRNVFNVLDPGLKRRNAAAHPSGVHIDQIQTDAYISDLIVNAALKIV
jgi:hypothetical protein